MSRPARSKRRPEPTPTEEVLIPPVASPGAPPVTAAAGATEAPRAPRPSEAPSASTARSARRPNTRRVTRVVRRIELWSILKLSIVIFFCLYLVVLGALVGIWNLAYGTGQIDRLQSFLGDVGLHDWRFYGDRMFRAAMAIGAIGVLASTVLSVLFFSLVNVVSEMTGGIRFSVIEEEPRRRR